MKNYLIAIFIILIACKAKKADNMVDTIMASKINHIALKGSIKQGRSIYPRGFCEIKFPLVEDSFNLSFDFLDNSINPDIALINKNGPNRKNINNMFIRSINKNIEFAVTQDNNLKLIIDTTDFNPSKFKWSNKYIHRFDKMWYKDKPAFVYLRIINGDDTVYNWINMIIGHDFFLNDSICDVDSVYPRNKDENYFFFGIYKWTVFYKK